MIPSFVQATDQVSLIIDGSLIKVENDGTVTIPYKVTIPPSLRNTGLTLYFIFNNTTAGSEGIPTSQTVYSHTTQYSKVFPVGTTAAPIKAQVLDKRTRTPLSNTFSTDLQSATAHQPITGAPATPVKPVTNPSADQTATNNQAVTAQTEFGNLSNLGQYMHSIMGYALPLGIALSILMTIYAGIVLMTSQGSPDRVKDAQEIVQGAILGLVVLILSRLLIDFLLLPGTTTSLLITHMLG